MPEARKNGTNYESQVYELLHDAVRDELRIYAGVSGIDLPSEALETFAWAVATRIDYAFSLTWDPDWVSPGEAHVWTENGRIHARCTSCLTVSPPMDSESSVRAWHQRHRTNEHKVDSTDK